MIGIFYDQFVDFLRSYLGDPVRVKSRNIICRCPWCEVSSNKKHYHLNISTEAPIFHCFYAGCNKSGTISTLIKKIIGKDTSENYIDFSKVKELSKSNINLETSKILPSVCIPKFEPDQFPYKSLYVKSRLKFSNISLSSIKGLVFDINKFFQMNESLISDPQSLRLKQFFHENFVGFLTENNSILILRNINSRSKFRYSKIKLFPTMFFDYYKLNGNCNNNHIILGEGIFDIFAEHIFNSLGLKDSARLYATALSTSYGELIRSIVYHEQIFRVDVSILSDSDVKIYYYQKLKRSSPCIRKMDVYYNKRGKDFNDTPVLAERIVL